MDIIVTTPKGQMAAAAQEAADCIADGGGEYFRRFHSLNCPHQLHAGDRVYYVEDGFIRGFCTVSRVQAVGPDGMVCDTTGRRWSQGFFAFMPASSWKWIRPIPMRGFQGFQYVNYGASAGPGGNVRVDGANHEVVIVGGWLDPRPEARA